MHQSARRCARIVNDAPSKKLAVRARQPPWNPHHGQYIYLFHHIKTKQIIYSLDQAIHAEKQEQNLRKQLTFYGKKTVPSKLRRDYWRQFAKVTMPSAEDGLYAYKLLREYRVVRDHGWTFKPTEADEKGIESDKKLKQAAIKVNAVENRNSLGRFVSKDEAFRRAQSDFARAELKQNEIRIAGRKSRLAAIDKARSIKGDPGYRTESYNRAEERVEALERQRKELEAKVKRLDPASLDKEEALKLPSQLAHRYDNITAHYAEMPSKRERARLLMDQRATSVADLADVIKRTLNRSVDGKHFANERKTARLWWKIKMLAETNEKHVQKLEQERDQLEATAKSTTPVNQQTRAERMKLKNRMKRVSHIKQELGRIRKAKEAVTFARGGEVSLRLRKLWRPSLRYVVQMQNKDRPVIPWYDLDAAQARKEKEAVARPANWPKDKKWDGSGVPKLLTKRDRMARIQVRRDNGLTPRLWAVTGARADPLERMLGDVEEGEEGEAEAEAEEAEVAGARRVLIEWGSVADAQYAQKWHGTVRHEAMRDWRVEQAMRFIADKEDELERRAYADEGVDENVEGEEMVGEREFMKEDQVSAEEKAQEGDGKSVPPAGVMGKLDPRKWFGGRA